MIEKKLRLIAQTLGIRIARKSTSGWLQASCPFAPFMHKRGTDRHNSFAMMVCDDGNSVYKCLGCNMSGRISSLVRSLEFHREITYAGLALKCDMADAEGFMALSYEETIAHRLAENEADNMPPVDESAISGAYEPAWTVPVARDYLIMRGTTKETAELLGVVYDPDDYRVMYPVRDRKGVLYGFTGRSILEENEYPYREYPKIRDYLGLPKRQLLLGEHLWQPKKPALIIEGLMGWSCLISQGVREVCNPLCLLGMEMTPGKVNRLEMLGAGVYLMLDNDQGGDIGLYGRIEPGMQDHNGDGAISRLQRRGMVVFVPDWPNGKDDPDQLTFDDVATILDQCLPYENR